MLSLDELTFRAPTLDDAPDVAELISARNRTDFGERDLELSGDDLREWWAERPDALATDAWIAIDRDRVVGFAKVRREGDVANVEDESCVHPELRGRRIGSALLDRAEGWARKRQLTRIHAHVVNDDGRKLLEERGFQNIRFFWRMTIDLDGVARPAVTPDGFEIRSYEPGTDDRALHAMHQAAFAEHWEFVPEPLDEWLGRTKRSDYDPELWQLAVRGNEIAGAALCFGWRDRGWVLDLAVGPAWRKKGLGIALLQAGFHGLSRRGFRHIGLEVDSENETGATRLYERVGMRVTRRYATFEKRLVG
jgi:mycothiol synthase